MENPSRVDFGIGSMMLCPMLVTLDIIDYEDQKQISLLVVTILHEQRTKKESLDE